MVSYACRTHPRAHPPPPHFDHALDWLIWTLSPCGWGLSWQNLVILLLLAQLFRTNSHPWLARCFNQGPSGILLLLKDSLIFQVLLHYELSLIGDALLYLIHNTGTKMCKQCAMCMALYKFTDAIQNNTACTFRYMRSDIAYTFRFIHSLRYTRLGTC